MTLRYTIEIEGEDKPACVAETVVLLLLTPTRLSRHSCTSRQNAATLAC